jgi:hypothetical protein
LTHAIKDQRGYNDIRRGAPVIGSNILGDEFQSGGGDAEIENQPGPAQVGREEIDADDIGAEAVNQYGIGGQQNGSR